MAMPLMQSIITSPDHRNNIREIELGQLKNTINKYIQKDVHFVVYRLSYAGKYIIIKGKTLGGSLIILADTLNSFNKDNKARFNGHLYTHLYNHIIDNPGGRFRIKIIAKHSKKTSFYELLKIEQTELDNSRYDKKCLNNQIECYIPKYNEDTRMYGWIPAIDVMNYKRWLGSKARQEYLDACYNK